MTAGRPVPNNHTTTYSNKNEMDMTALAVLCDAHNLLLIEDGAQSFGAIGSNGVRSCSCSIPNYLGRGFVATTSF